MPDKPTANPSEDPSPEKQERPRLKLKRLVVKDIEIKPQVSPDAEPVPQAETYSDPEPPPNQTAEAPPAPPEPTPKIAEDPDPIPPPPPCPEETPRENVQPEIPQKKEGLPESPPTPGSVEEKKKGDKPKTEKKKRRKRSQIFPLILIVGSLLYGTHILFDPLGLKPEPATPSEIPLEAADPKEADEEPSAIPDSPDVSLPQTVESANGIPAYLDKVSNLPITLSANPDGVFIGPVHYTEGMAINPSLGLIIETIVTEPGNQHLLLKDADGSTYTIPVN